MEIDVINVKTPEVSPFITKKHEKLRFFQDFVSPASYSNESYNNTDELAFGSPNLSPIKENF